jgi:hypothetical protein
VVKAAGAFLCHLAEYTYRYIFRSGRLGRFWNAEEENQMAVSPQDIALTADELAEVARLESDIDSILKAQYVQGNRWTNITLKGLENITPRIKNELARRYQAVGWGRIEIVDKGRWKFHSA